VAELLIQSGFGLGASVGASVRASVRVAEVLALSPGPPAVASVTGSKNSFYLDVLGIQLKNSDFA